MTCRFLYDNLITDEDMFDVSSLRVGIVTSALKEGTGSATLGTSGNFSGEVDLEYTVEIDSVTGGKEIGQATFKWSDGLGSFNATGVVTSSSPITLNNGVQITFTAGSGDDFELGDKWFFKAVNNFNPGKMIDYHRDTRYRSSGIDTPANTITINLGSAQAVNSIVLYDHNLPIDSVINFEANSSDSWGSPPVSESITVTSDTLSKILKYLSDTYTYQYWRIEIIPFGTTITYVEIGEMFLGEYFEPNRTVDARTPSRDINSLQSINQGSYGIEYRRFYNNQKDFSYAFSYIEDIVDFQMMFESLGDKDTGIIKPLFFHEESTEIADFWLVYLDNLPYRFPLNDRRSTTLLMKEVVSSV